MKAQEAVGWFGVVAVVAATMAFGSGGWDGWEIASAAFLGITAVVLLVIVYLERLLDWIEGEVRDDIRRALIEDAEAIYSLASHFFGDAVTSSDQIRSLIRKNKGLFFVLCKNTPDYLCETIQGYGCIFPMSDTQVKEIEALTFSFNSLQPSSLPRGRSNVAAVYVGAVVGSGFRARAKMLGYVEAKAQDSALRSKLKTVYAKAASNDGLRTMLRKGFHPIRAEYNGLNCFYKKVVA